VAQYPTSASALTGTGEAIPSLPSRNAIRAAAGACTAELAVLLLRGSAFALLLSPAMLAAFLLAG
jgi:hypothetical protein